MINTLKSYVIRLKDIVISEKLSAECVHSGSSNGLEIEMFDGIYGKDNIKNKTLELGIRPYREKMKKNRLGVRGCFLSHYLLWLKSLEINEPILICEHDAIILAEITDDILNFEDVLILDPHDKFSSKYESAHLNSRGNIQKIVEYFNKDSRKKMGVSAEYPKGLQSYIIKPSAAKKLYQSVKNNGYLPADVQINKSIVTINTVTRPVASINQRYYNDKKTMREESTTQQEWIN